MLLLSRLLVFESNGLLLLEFVLPSDDGQRHRASFLLHVLVEVVWREHAQVCAFFTRLDVEMLFGLGVIAHGLASALELADLRRVFFVGVQLLGLAPGLPV